ncbi:MAG TPA: DUF1844 domain-containing protein [Pyrinomonadaceae bacterium]|jgi:hypothetical protein|nr:DUF1844 domain-containing protein [Pyrinomonadaceae bacterium]
MSEEQNTFKVRDRRLFNPDGTPREIERDETTEAATVTPETEAGDRASSSSSSKSSGGDATPVAGASAQPSSAAASPSSVEQRLSGAASARQEAAGSVGRDADTREPSPAPPEARSEEEDLYAEGDVPGANDPASFINFLMSIASNAAASLGMMEHPVTGQSGVDLQLAKHWIDVLGMLQQKTRGNLVAQEQQIFEGLLADLRLQYVSLTTPPASPRGFTGRDITGGK